MPVYVVSYDLNKPYQKYEKLWKFLESLGGKRVLLSQWAVHAKGDAIALRDALRPLLIDDDDRLLVMARDSNECATYNPITKLSTF